MKKISTQRGCKICKNDNLSETSQIQLEDDSDEDGLEIEDDVDDLEENDENS